MVRKSVSKISPTILYVFWVHPWFWAPRSAQKRHLAALRSIFAGSERRCADTAKWRAFRTFRPTVAPNWTTRSGNKARDPLTQSDRFRNVRWITRPPQGARSVGIALSWCRWTPTTALPMALLAHSWGPKPGMYGYPKNVRSCKMHRSKCSRWAHIAVAIVAI